MEKVPNKRESEANTAMRRDERATAPAHIDLSRAEAYAINRDAISFMRHASRRKSRF